jgi:sphinganine-1-phosphate aldolase
MYFVFTEWPGGVYASPAMAGSRPGGLIACCWASLVAIGKDGFYEKSKNIYDTVQQVKEGYKFFVWFLLKI